MDPQANLVVIRGGGDLATGVAYRLDRAGFPIVVLELDHPTVIRRSVALASALWEGRINVEELTGIRVSSIEEGLHLVGRGSIPVLAAPELPNWEKYRGQSALLPPKIIIDARMAKRNIDTRIDQAPLVIALGPGFVAGLDCHAVIETKRGHRLGRVIWQGSAEPNTGTPGVVAGKSSDRVLRAPTGGPVRWYVNIGQAVRSSEKLGEVGHMAVVAPSDGVVRGLIFEKTLVQEGMKIGDIDARMDISACFTISDKALAIGGGVLEAVLS